LSIKDYILRCPDKSKLERIWQDRHII
jgi:hypothetical protein